VIPFNIGPIASLSSLRTPDVHIWSDQVNVSMSEREKSEVIFEADL